MFCLSHIKGESLYSQTQKLIRQKELEISEFSVYWDTECSMYGNLSSAEVQVCF